MKFSFELNDIAVNLTVYKMYAWTLSNKMGLLTDPGQDFELGATLGYLPPITPENARQVRHVLTQALVPHTKYTGVFKRQRGSGKHPVAYAALIEAEGMEFYLVPIVLKSAKDAWDNQKGLSLLHSRIISELTSVGFDIDKSTRKEIAKSIGVQVSEDDSLEEDLPLEDAIDVLFATMWDLMGLNVVAGGQPSSLNPDINKVDKVNVEESDKEKAHKWLQELEKETEPVAVDDVGDWLRKLSLEALEDFGTLDDLSNDFWS